MKYISFSQLSYTKPNPKPKKGINDVKMRQKSKIKARSVTENRTGGMEGLPDV